MFMRSHSIRPLIHVAVLLGACAGLSACEDASSSERAAAQEAIDKAAAALQAASLSALTASGDEDAIAKSQATLTQVVNSLNAISGGAEGQQAAKAMLAATAHEHLARLGLDQANELESTLQSTRNELFAQVEAIRTLNAVSESFGGVKPESQREELAAARRSAEERAAQLDLQLQELAEPIDVHERSIADAAKRVQELRIEVRRLMREANELGASAGFSTFEQSVAIGREADGIEKNIAEREIELGYNLESERDLLMQEVQAMQAQMESVHQTLAALDEMEQAYTADARTARNRANELQSKVQEQINSIDGEMGGRLAELYTKIGADLDKASSLLDQASRGAGSDPGAVKLAKARVAVTRGRAALAQSRGLAHHHALLARLNEAARGTNGSRLSAVESEAAQAREKAIESFMAARDTLGSTTTRGSQSDLESFKASVDRILAELQKPAATSAAGAIASSAADDSNTSASDADTTTASAGGQGFASPEEYVEFMKAFGRDGTLTDDVQRAVAAHVAETRNGKLKLNMIRATGDSLANLFEAMVAQFGLDETFAAFDSAGLSLSPQADSITIADRTEDSCIVSYMEGPQEKSDTLKKIGDAWFIDGDDIDPEETQLLPMADALTRAMNTAAKDVAGRVKAGEFADASSVITAFQQAMTAAFQG